MPDFTMPSCLSPYCGSEYMEQVRKDIWHCPRCGREYRIPTHDFRLDEMDPRTGKMGDDIDISNSVQFRPQQSPRQEDKNESGRDQPNELADLGGSTGDEIRKDKDTNVDK